MSLPAVAKESPRASFAPSTIVVLSDRPVVRDCIVGYLRHAGFPRTTGLPSWPTRRSVTRPPDLLLVDARQGEADLGDLLRQIHGQWPATTTVAIGDPMQLAAHAADADGWVELSEPGLRLSTIAKAVTRPHDGRLRFAAPPDVRRQLGTWTSLTHRQRQVLALLGCGVGNPGLAKALGVSERTVKMHVTALFEKFHVGSRTQLALIACRAGLGRRTGAPDDRVLVM